MENSGKSRNRANYHKISGKNKKKRAIKETTKARKKETNK